MLNCLRTSSFHNPRRKKKIGQICCFIKDCFEFIAFLKLFKKFYVTPRWTEKLGSREQHGATPSYTSQRLHSGLEGRSRILYLM